MNERAIYSIYRRRFLPVYADYVVLKQEKPEQILIEESNVLSHLSQVHNPAVPPHLQLENLRKGYAHLYRAILDLNKLVWASLSEQLRPLAKSDERFLMCFNIPEGEVLARFARFREEGRKARRMEMGEVGVSPLRSAVRYQRANAIAFDLLTRLDPQKRARIDGWLCRLRGRELLLGFLLGVGASYVANHIPLLKGLLPQGGNSSR